MLHADSTFADQTGTEADSTDSQWFVPSIEKDSGHTLVTLRVTAELWRFSPPQRVRVSCAAYGMLLSEALYCATHRTHVEYPRQ